MSLYRSTWDQAAKWHLGTIDSCRDWSSDDDTFEQMYDDGDSTAIARRAWLLHVELFGPLSKADLLDMLVGKQKDYGSQNIMRFGIEGIKVRLWDKIARYNNLVGKDATSDPVNESLADTFKDMIGYVVLWWMVEDEEMELPLEVGEYTRVYELPGEDYGPVPKPQLPPPNPNFTLELVGYATPLHAHEGTQPVYQMVPYTGDIT